MNIITNNNPWQQFEMLPAEQRLEDARHQTLKQVLNNLNQVLNTRKVPTTATDDDIHSQLLNYGIDDLSQFNPESVQQRQQLCQTLQQCISNYEPRLKQLFVECIHHKTPPFLDLYFQITGVLTVPEPPSAIQMVSIFHALGQYFTVEEQS